jgi:hypothetical protein
MIRETREGWPLLTVKTEANGDSKSTNERGPSSVTVIGFLMPVQAIFVLLAAVVGPVRNIFFLSVHYLNSFLPIAQHAGQAVMQGRQSLTVCLW